MIEEGQQGKISRDKRCDRTVFSWLFGWPWIDPVVACALRRWYFPLSRLWAAAGVAVGSLDRFFEAVPLDPLRSPRRGIKAILADFEGTRMKAAAIDAAWLNAFFEGNGVEDAPSAMERQELENERLEAHHRHNLMRFQFRRLLQCDVPRACFAIPTPGEVKAVYGWGIVNRSALFAVPDPIPQPAVSADIPTSYGRDFWLSFASPSNRLGDRVFARVHEPAGVANPPTLIFGHGICVEFDQWRRTIDEVDSLLARGIRIIRPEAPWHGRRTPPGFYGGERIIATFPMGSLDLFTGAVREWAVLADWARRTSSGPLAFGGSSLGALTAQLTAECAQDWPQALRPDALLLVTHAPRLLDIVAEGDLTRIWGGRDLIESKGWAANQLEVYLSLISAASLPSVSPEHIVTVLGRRDRIIPFASALKQIEDWCIPEVNRFIWDRGHFSIPPTMISNADPINRFCNILKEI
jgi:pimeloyl-ACP methyl ester carboxylesterase